VVICALDTAEIGSTQERIGSPFTQTVQAPHWAIPQPYFVPKSDKWSLKAHNNGVLGSMSKETFFLFTVQLIAIVRFIIDAILS
jgi:hypothetical protein